MALDQVFIEQAEYLEDASFISWSTEHPDEGAILRKLTHGGAKLISGPRGCGKTTLLLKAYNAMLSSSEAAFPVYVNYKRSLSIEPMYKSGTDGTFWFNQWVLLKLYLGLYDSIEKLGLTVQLSIGRDLAKRTAAYLEMSKAGMVEIPPLSIPTFEEDLSQILSATSRQRCVLLLDDAAHAFSPDQQRDFFDFFRQIKSQKISPKAAIYPGVTNYSSSFHVGHDAEQIDVWIKPDRAEYLEFMKKVIRSRFSEEVEAIIDANGSARDLLCFAAFGVPRALLNMLQSLMSEDSDGDISISLNRLEVLRAIKDHYRNTKKLFTSLKAKIPVYQKFIATGEDILSSSIQLVKQYNSQKDITKQSVSIALADSDISAELTRIFALLQYAGLCIPKDDLVSRGVKGRFRLYSLHYAGLIDANALIGARSTNIPSLVEALSERNAHEFTRTRPSGLLSGVTQDIAFALSLPPCASCGTARQNANAQFCSNCGSPLTSASTYLDLVDRDISELPLTPTRIKKIKEQSPIRKIKDILVDHEHTALLSVDRIGVHWAEKIVRLAEEFVE